MEYLREQYSKQRIEFNKTIMAEKAKNRTVSEQNIIRNKKRATFHARPIGEHQLSENIIKLVMKESLSV